MLNFIYSDSRISNCQGLCLVPGIVADNKIAGKKVAVKSSRLSSGEDTLIFLIFLFSFMYLYRSSYATSELEDIY